MASTDETKTPPDSVKQSEMPSTSGTVEEAVVPEEQVQSIVESEETVVPVEQALCIVEPEKTVVPGVRVQSIVEPERREVQGWLFWITIWLVVPTICSITFTTFLVFATPIGLFLSPILVPLGVILFFAAAGVLSGAGFGLAALSAVMWVYKYFRGEEPVYFDRIAAVTNRIAGYIPHQLQGVQRASDISMKIPDGTKMVMSLSIRPPKPDSSRRGSSMSD